jgi:mono/diheme cytochrome c family protein
MQRDECSLTPCAETTEAAKTGALTGAASRWTVVTRAMMATCVVVLVGVATSSRTGVAAQGAAGRTIWDGVYTDGQAVRGQAIFQNSCSRCHNNELVGSERGPALKGDAFWQRWDSDSFDKLFTKVRDTMPQAEIESVTDARKIDALAFILSKNGAPAGAKELTAELVELEGITIVRQGGVAGGVANFNLVQVVGCLQGDATRGWTLTQATAPLVTKEDAADAAALAKNTATPLGTETFQLVSVVPGYGAAELAGRKVDARGLLYRSASETLLNLTGLRSVGLSCP